jgi:hypothetical protein
MTVDSPFPAEALQFDNLDYFFGMAVQANIRLAV